MRNALVLVLLCIGLTSGFIVPTSTTEANNLTQTMVTKKQDAITAHEAIMKNNSIVSTDFNLHLYNIKPDDAQQELYNEGSKINKNIEERSFILVNQRWSKQPFKSHIIDTKLTNSVGNGHDLKKKTNLNVFQEDARENVLPEMGVVHTKYLIDKQELYTEYNKARNKSNQYYTTTHRIDSRFHSIQDNSKQYVGNKVIDNENHLGELLKTSLTRPSIKTYENVGLREIKFKDRNKAFKKHFTEFTKGNNYIDTIKNRKQNITKGYKERDENSYFFRDIIQDPLNESYVDILTQQKLFHLLLEEQIPYKQAVYKNYSTSWSNSKYCRKCARLAKLSNLNIDKECDCRCGRYIHLKGRTESKH